LKHKKFSSLTIYLVNETSSVANETSQTLCQKLVIFIQTNLQGSTVQNLYFLGEET